MATNNDDEQLIREGASRLSLALAAGSVTRERIIAEQVRDTETVRVREYWGDHNDEQKLITRGIKLRIEARRRLLGDVAVSEEHHRCA